MDQEKTLRLKAEGREFAKKIRSLLQFIRAVTSQKSEQFLKQNVLLFFFFLKHLKRQLEQIIRM